LDVAGRSTANGANVQQWGCISSASNQQWQFTDCGNGIHMLKAAHSGKNLKVYNGSTANGANLEQRSSYSCGTSLNSPKFRFINRGGSPVQYALQVVHSGKCVDVSGGVTATNDGQNVHQWDCHYRANQLFTLQPVGSTTPPPSGSLPSGWSSRDIGSVAASGSASYSNGVYNVTGSGADIWGANDEFHFAYRQLSGDGSITARVTSLQNTNAWAKAGVMFRESLNSNSRHAATVVTPSNGIAFQRRTSTGGSSAHTGASGGTGYWVRVERSGSTFTAKRSSDGSNFSSIGSASISMPSTVYVGLAVTSHADGTRATSTFSNVNVASGGTTPPPPPPSSGFAGVVSEEQFEEMFPIRSSFYTYQGLVNAAAAYPGFANSSDATLRKREAAAFLANINHESDRLRAVREYNQNNYCNYCDAGQWYGCPAGRCQYFGRGPMQLSWNFNYKAAGDALGIDLLNTPDLVATDPTVAWKTALWFWMTSTGAGRMTCHNAIVNNAGFGETIQTINGALECGRDPTHSAVITRVSYFQSFCQILSVSTGSNLYC
jgi:predicted chitinase/regulation of enolase protein 1 (concanavalin A-like superfamily)